MNIWTVNVHMNYETVRVNIHDIHTFKKNIQGRLLLNRLQRVVV